MASIRPMSLWVWLAGTAVLLSLTAPTKVLADGFTIQWSGTLETGASVSGLAIVTATEEGGGEFLVDSIVSGSQTVSGFGTGSLSVLPLYPDPASYDFADNLIWPASNSPGGAGSPANALVDNAGLSFTDGTYDYIIYAVNLGPSVPEYWECTTQDGSTCIGGTSDIAGPLASLTITTAPEPTTATLLGIGVFGFLALSARRKRHVPPVSC